MHLQLLRAEPFKALLGAVLAAPACIEHACQLVWKMPICPVAITPGKVVNHEPHEILFEACFEVVNSSTSALTCLVRKEAMHCRSCKSPFG